MCAFGAPASARTESGVVNDSAANTGSDRSMPVSEPNRSRDRGPCNETSGISRTRLTYSKSIPAVCSAQCSPNPAVLVKTQ